MLSSVAIKMDSTKAAIDGAIFLQIALLIATILYALTANVSMSFP